MIIKFPAPAASTIAAGASNGENNFMAQATALNSLRIIYKNNRPHGIRDKNGFLLFFPVITKFTGQEERYRNEIEKQFSLADFLLESLKAKK